MRTPRLLAIVVAFAALQPPARAESPRDLRARVRAHREANELAILRELSELLAIPNVASDRANIRRNADRLVEMLGRRGITARLLEAEGSPPAVFGELRVPGAKRTVILYAHYDGQPVDPAAWRGEPFRPVLRDRRLEEGGKEIPFPTSGRTRPDWRLYARSASDDKGPIVGMLAAIDALRAARIPLSVNVGFFFEGEEEAGSPHLRAILEKHADLLRADVWLFCDGPVHQSGRKQLVFGARGSVGLELTVYGANRTLHSGHYGNWAPNPIVVLSHLIASMRGDGGEIRVAGLADQVVPLTDAERASLRAIPDVEAKLRRSFDLGASEGRAPIAERILAPALNLRGIASGGVGALTTNSIPTHAVASMDFRLVPKQTVDHLKAAVEEHLRRQGFFLVRRDPDAATRRAHPRLVKVEWQPGYPAYRTSIDQPVSRLLEKLLAEASGAKPVMLPSFGGSLPLYLFDEVLHVPVITLPVVNHDNNQHAANEDIRLGHLWDGIEIYAVILARLGELWP